MARFSKREKTLLGVLAGLVLLIGFVIFFLIRNSALQETEEQITLLEQNITLLQSLQTNEAELREYHAALSEYYEKEKVKYFSPDETDLTQLSQKILAMLSKYNLSYSRLKKNETSAPYYIEISFSGHAGNLVRFLQEIAREPKYINIFSINISNRNNQLNVTMRCNHATV